MAVFLYMLCTLTIFAAAHRELSFEESKLMRLLWGTDDVAKLIEIEQRPQEYWHERAKVLLAPEATMTHEEFCRQHIEDAKAHIAQQPKYRKCKLPWFAEPDVLELCMCGDFWEDMQRLEMQRFLYEQARIAVETPHEDHCMHSMGEAREALRVRKRKFCCYQSGARQELAELEVEKGRIFLQELRQSAEELWFTEPNALEGVLKEFVPEGSMEFIDALSVLYAQACDYIHCCFFRTTPWAFLETREATCAELRRKRCSFVGGFPPDFVKRLRWQVLPGGQFSLFDSLVMRSNRYFLCSVSSNFSKRDTFSAHGRFFGWMGLRQHDVNGHALAAYTLETRLAEEGIPEDAYFGGCCNPELMPVGNLVDQSNWVQGHFYQCHDLPGSEDLLKGKSGVCLLFPRADVLLDEGFMRITPYLMDVPIDFDWKTTPFRRAVVDEHQVHGYLMGLRQIFCFPNVRFVPLQGIVKYIKRLSKELICLSERDLARTPGFILQVFDALGSRMIQNWSDETQEVLRKEAYDLAQFTVSSLEYVVRKEGRKPGFFFFVDVHPIQYFLVNALYARNRISLLKENCCVRFNPKRNDVGFAVFQQESLERVQLFDFTLSNPCTVFKDLPL